MVFVSQHMVAAEQVNLIAIESFGDLCFQQLVGSGFGDLYY